MNLRSLLPPFFHDFPQQWQHNWEYEEAHSKQSGLHIEIDFILNTLQEKPLRRLQKHPALHRSLRALISFGFGLNCGFPIVDIIKFVRWEYQLNKSIEEDLKKIIHLRRVS